MLNPFHYTIDLQDCKSEQLGDINVIKQYIIDICIFLYQNRKGQPNILKFPDAGGITATQILQDSLLSIHTYPEHSMVYIDLFSCKAYNPSQFLDYTKIFFKSNKATMARVHRMGLQMPPTVASEAIAIRHS